MAPLTLSTASRRGLDVVLSVISLLVLAPLLLAVAILVKITSRGPVLHWSSRIGMENRTFKMPKFRTMRIDAPVVAKHLLVERELYLTPIGSFLRRFSIDELPQLFSILRGDITFVGPRPALHSQHDLIRLRTDLGIHRLTPGLTGWAQVNGRDTLTLKQKVEFDRQYLQRRCLLFDIRILLLTLPKAFRGDSVAP